MVLAPTFAEFCKAHGLTESEARMTGLILRGLTSRQIGMKLGCAEGTIKNHMIAVYRKTGIAEGHSRKRLLLMIHAQQWLKEEKSRRVRERMNA